MMTKALVPQSGVSRHGGSTFVSKEGSELTVNGLQMRQVVVLDEDEVAMSVTCCRLSDSMVMGANVVPFPEMLLGNDAWAAAFGHAGGVGGTNANPAGVAILIGEMEFNETIAMSVDVDAFDVDGIAKSGVAARDECRTMGLQAEFSTSVDKAKGGRRGDQRGVVGHGCTHRGLHVGGGVAGRVVGGRATVSGVGGIRVMGVKVFEKQITEVQEVSGW
jgi:hypothetical protein